MHAEGGARRRKRIRKKRRVKGRERADLGSEIPAQFWGALRSLSLLACAERYGAHLGHRMAEVGNIKGKTERAWECKEERAWELPSYTCSFLETECFVSVCGDHERNAFSRPFREQGMVISITQSSRGISPSGYLTVVLREIRRLGSGFSQVDPVFLKKKPAGCVHRVRTRL